MLDAKGYSFTGFDEILKVSKGNKEMLQGMKTISIKRLKGQRKETKPILKSCTAMGATTTK